jgi:hypothetical protein
VREWFENSAMGVEQGWTIAARPDGDGPLSIDLEISGLTACRDETGRSAVLTDASGAGRVRYRNLSAFDSCGVELDAKMQPRAGGIAVQIDDEGATYPLSVDPWLGAPDWTGESDQADAHLGTSVSGAGDVNGDGFADVIVGAPDFDNGQSREGRAYLYLGSVSGLALAPDWIAESDPGGALFGKSVSGAGDVNGDGFDDVIVGAPMWSRAFLYYGSADGVSLTADWTVVGLGSFGRSVSAAGNVNGDDFDDVIVGADTFTDGQHWEGGAMLFLGSPGGLSITPDWTAEGDQEYALFGMCVSGAGDVNGDGFDDVIVGAANFDDGEQNEGGAFVYLGSAGGPSLAPA